MFTEIRSCIACGGTVFNPVISLGEHYVVDFITRPGAGDQLKAPLVLVRCLGCNMVQLTHKVNPDRLYRKFWYCSGINEAMRAALRDVAASANAAVWPRRGERVLDIGCNDGTLLELYPDKLTKVGIDPAKDQLLDGHSAGRIQFPILGYFSKDAVKNWAPYKIITAVAMFYDVTNPLQFLEDCRDVLDPSGMLVIQMNYLKTMLEDIAFDNICHEHVTYYSLMTMEYLVRRAGLEIQGVSVNGVNGGSIRLYITHPSNSGIWGWSAERAIEAHALKYKLLQDEHDMGMDTDRAYANFALNVNEVTNALKTHILNQADGDVAVYGASTRGSTLMQALDLPEGKIKYAAERDEKKLGLYTVGTNLLIQDEEFCRSSAKQFLVLPWHFIETIKRREDTWLARGGTMLVPLPRPYILAYEETEVVRQLPMEVYE